MSVTVIFLIEFFLATDCARAQQLRRWATVWPQQTWAESGGRVAVPLSVGGAICPHATQCGLGREAYLDTKWHFDPPNRLATIHQRHRQTTVW